METKHGRGKRKMKVHESEGIREHESEGIRENDATISMLGNENEVEMIR